MKNINNNNITSLISIITGTTIIQHQYQNSKNKNSSLDLVTLMFLNKTRKKLGGGDAGWETQYTYG